MTRVLIVNEDAGAAELLATLLRLSNPSIGTALAYTERAALMFATELQPDLVIIDLDSSRMKGEAVAEGVLAVCTSRRPALVGLGMQSAGAPLGNSEGTFDVVLAKPPVLEPLLQLIARLPMRTATREAMPSSVQVG
jgi:CheY-like chemotaxis protein